MSPCRGRDFFAASGSSARYCSTRADTSLETPMIELDWLSSVVS